MGTNLTVNNGNIDIPTASSSTLGVIKVGNGLSITNGVLKANITSVLYPSHGRNFVIKYYDASDTEV